MNLILASSSPRRRQLLEQIGLQFSVQVSNVAEDVPPGTDPIQHAQTLAINKATAVAGSYPEAVVIGADTIVVFAGKVFNKPVDKLEAKQMLAALNGKQHQVITGVAVAKGEKVYSACSITLVIFRQLTESEMENYLAAGEWIDKAGAYGIQGLGALLVERIEGCYSNVVGLPLVTLSLLLQKAGINVL